MNRLRLATWAAVAGLGMLSGCSSCDTCPREGFLTRIGLRPRTACVIFDGGGLSSEDLPISGAMPIGGCPTCANGGEGPILTDSGPPMPAPGVLMGPPPAPAPGATNGALPGPMPLQLTPVPPPGTPPGITPDMARPTPADPSSRTR